MLHTAIEHRRRGHGLRFENLAHDGADASWTLTTATPTAGRLLGVVAQMWEVRGGGAQAERILPTGHVEVMFNLGDPQWLCDPDRGRVPFRRAWVSGLQDTCLEVLGSPASHLVGCQLTPLGAHRVLGGDTGAIAGRVVDLEDLAARGLVAARQRLGDLDASEDRFEHLAGLLEARLAASAAPDPRLVRATALLERDPGASIQMLARQVGISHKHLIHRFRTAIGLTPKRYARVQRLRRVLDALDGPGAVDWTMVALAAGYYDQAHFIRDLRAFTGVKPSELLAQRSPDGGSLVGG